MAYDQNYIIKLADKKAAQLGYEEYSIEPRELTIGVGETKTINACNEFYFIVDVPFGISIDSDTGKYNKENPAIKDHILGHSGITTIRNHTNEEISIALIHLILISLKEKV